MQYIGSLGFWKQVIKVQDMNVTENTALKIRSGLNEL